MKAEISIVKVTKDGFYPRRYYEIIPTLGQRFKNNYQIKRKSILYILIDKDMEHVFFQKYGTLITQLGVI